MKENNAVDVSQVGSVRVLQLDNPERRNALSKATYSKLAEQLNQADQDPSVRVLVITGSDSCFCSGNDLDDFLGTPIKGASHPTFEFMRALSGFSKPVIAAVEGPAVGIGTTLLLHCDLVYAGHSAFFLMPFVQLGICPEFASSHILPRLLGHQRAAELLLLGERVEAREAKHLGLINQTVAVGEALSRAMEVAERMAAAPPKAMRESKRLLKETTNGGIDRALQSELAVLVEAVKYGELREAVSALKEKRAPDFSSFD